MCAPPSSHSLAAAIASLCCSFLALAHPVSMSSIFLVLKLCYCHRAFLVSYFLIVSLNGHYSYSMICMLLLLLTVVQFWHVASRDDQLIKHKSQYNRFCLKSPLHCLIVSTEVLKVSHKFVSIVNMLWFLNFDLWLTSNCYN